MGGGNVYITLIFRAWVVPSARGHTGRLYCSGTTFGLQSFHSRQWHAYMAPTLGSYGWASKETFVKLASSFCNRLIHLDNANYLHKNCTVFLARGRSIRIVFKLFTKIIILPDCLLCNRTIHTVYKMKLAWHLWIPGWPIQWAFQNCLHLLLDLNNIRRGGVDCNQGTTQWSIFVLKCLP